MHVGETVRVYSGPFAGMTGKIKRLADRILQPLLLRHEFDTLKAFRRRAIPVNRDNGRFSGR